MVQVLYNQIAETRRMGVIVLSTAPAKLVLSDSKLKNVAWGQV